MGPQAIIRLLSQPFPAKYVHENPSGGGSYIKHHVIEQRLIQVFGRPPNFELVEIVRGDVPAIEPNPNGKSKRAKEGSPALTNVVVGVIARLSVDVKGNSLAPDKLITSDTPDSSLTSVDRWVAEEAGDCEEPHNWKTDGQRLKDAMSDAYKRCAMRWGCGLHLWSQKEYFLHESLSNLGKSGNGSTGGGQPTATPASSPSEVSA